MISSLKQTGWLKYEWKAVTPNKQTGHQSVPAVAADRTAKTMQTGSIASKRLRLNSVLHQLL